MRRDQNKNNRPPTYRTFSDPTYPGRENVTEITFFDPPESRYSLLNRDNYECEAGFYSADFQFQRPYPGRAESLLSVLWIGVPMESRPGHGLRAWASPRRVLCVVVGVAVSVGGLLLLIVVLVCKHKYGDECRLHW